jgi:hypothetical protein
VNGYPHNSLLVADKIKIVSHNSYTFNPRLTLIPDNSQFDQHGSDESSCHHKVKETEQAKASGMPITRFAKQENIKKTSFPLLVV